MSLNKLIPDHIYHHIIGLVRYSDLKQDVKSLDGKTIFNCRLVCQQWNKVVNQLMNIHDLEKRSLLILFQGIHIGSLSPTASFKLNLQLLKIIQLVYRDFFPLVKINHLENILYELDKTSHLENIFSQHIKHMQKLLALPNMNQDSRAECLQYFIKLTDAIQSKGTYPVVDNKMTFLTLPQHEEEREPMRILGHCFYNTVQKFFREDLLQSQIKEMIESFSHKEERLYVLLKGIQNTMLSLQDYEGLSTRYLLYIDSNCGMYDYEKRAAREEYYQYAASQIEDIINESMLDLGKRISYQKQNLISAHIQLETLSFMEEQCPINQKPFWAIDVENKLSQAFAKELKVMKRSIKSYCLMYEPDKAFQLFTRVNIKEEDFSYLKEISSMMIDLIKTFPDFSESENIKSLLEKYVHPDYFWLKEAMLLSLIEIEKLKQAPSELTLLEQKLTLLSDEWMKSSLPTFKALLMMTDLYSQLENYTKATLYLSKAWRIYSLMENNNKLKAYIELIKTAKKLHELSRPLN
ncbi:hypothetical protein [Rhabdochlamydiaceae symbiont of Dictyostelium giganteum]|uniref:hypothetical protein n=1 Tax=Rhabdochlamydiaceae symbiont of Dictyostelium giganteum TaxID=3342349 RepID=UPI0038510289